MSLFIDVPDTLSNSIKRHFTDVIENERKGQERSVRKICDVCFKYLKYGDLIYYRMEDSISQLKGRNTTSNSLYALLMVVLNESLDEDQTTMNYLNEYSNSALAEPLRQELSDLITIGRFTTFKEYSLLEDIGSILIDRYTDEKNITDTISNLYLKAEDKEHLPVFHKLLNKAKEIYPDSIQIEGLCSFFHMQGEDYDKALASLFIVKQRLEQDTDNRFYHINLASAWDSIAGCYIKQGNAEKTIESCDTALSYVENAESYIVANPILYKKAETLLMLGENEQALDIVNQILHENEDDEKAMEIKNRII